MLKAIQAETVCAFGEKCTRMEDPKHRYAPCLCLSLLSLGCCRAAFAHPWCDDKKVPDQVLSSKLLLVG